MSDDLESLPQDAESMSEYSGGRYSGKDFNLQAVSNALPMITAEEGGTSPSSMNHHLSLSIDYPSSSGLSSPISFPHSPRPPGFGINVNDNASSAPPSN
jgi:hypothetical protein